MGVETNSATKALAGCLQALLIAALLAWLYAVPFGVMLAVSAVVGYVPEQATLLGAVATPGALPEWATGLIATGLAWLAEMLVFAPTWLLTRRRAGWAWLGAASAGLVLISTYQALWGIGGAVLHDQLLGAAALRLALTWPFLLAVVLASRSLQAFRPPALSTLLLAAGLAAGLLLPWLILGALGTLYFTSASLVRALVNGVGEEIVFRGLLMLWLTRTTRQPWLAAIVSILAYLAAQNGYILPLGDWFVMFRLVVAACLGLLMAELFARGSLWPAILVHVAYEFGPLAFVDWRMRASSPHPAAFESMLIVGSLGLALWLGRLAWNAFSRSTFHVSRSTPRPVGEPSTSNFKPLTFNFLPAAAFAALAILVALGAYIAWGHPGFYHDGILIVLKEQADVSPAYAIPDRTERLAYVYETLTETATRTQAPLRAELDRLGVAYRPYYLINMIRVDDLNDVSKWILTQRLAGRDDVAAVISNPNLRETRYFETMMLMSTPDEPNGVEWNIRAVKADQAWQLGVTGEGIVVASADTGVEWNHPAVQARYRGWDGAQADHDYNWYDAWNDAPAPWDDVGHGTHTVGTMLGDDGQGNQVGMAPGAQWVACRNMRAGLGNPGAYVACMEFFLAPWPRGGDALHDGQPALAAHVINNSWGCPEFEGCAPDTLQRAVENLRAAGVMMVVSAGNDGPGCSTIKDPPANYDASFSVGAEQASGEITSFSSRGPAVGEGVVKPDVTAPGYDVRSAVPGGGYVPSAGTSMAGPHVAGLVALLWSANPALVGDIERTEDIIRSTARPRQIEAVCDPLEQSGSICGCGDDALGQVPNNVYGYGLIDALEAVQAARR